MNYAFIKNNICYNIVVFDDSEVAEAFEAYLKEDGLVDEIVILANGFGIGDSYLNGIWIKKQPIAEPPTAEERIAALESAISFLLGM